MVDPNTIGTIAKGFGGVFDAFGGPAPIIGTTRSDIDRAAGAVSNNYGAAADIGRGGFTIGDNVLTLPTKTTKADRRSAIADAAKAEALSRGLTNKQAERFARKASRGGLGKKGKNRFKDFLRESGEDYGLGISSTGRITMLPTTPGSFGPASSADTSGTGGADGYVGDLLEGLSGVAPGLSEDVQAGLDFRGNVRDYFSNLLPTMDDQGLTEQDYANLNATRAEGTRNVQERFRDDLQRTTGDLLARGFMSSSLAGQALQRGAFDPYSRNLVDLEANQARLADQFRNSAVNRRSQSIKNILSMEAGLGGSSAAPITSAFVSPSAYGGFTDPQAFNASLDALRTSQGLYTDKGKTLGDIYRSPTIQTNF